MRWMRFWMAAIALLLCLPATAQQAQDVKWRAVEGLAPGELVELRDRATGVHTECVLAYASDAALGCDTGSAYDPPRRVVYPRAGIGAVWVVRWVHGPSGQAMLIGASIGGVLGGIVLGESSSKGATAAGIGLGAAIGLGCSNIGDPFHTRMSKRRHLVYRAN